MLDVFEDKKLNNFTPENSRPVPFTNMIYIGDGLTDVPCMKLVKYNGGKSIAVHKQGDMETSYQLMREQRIDFFAEADYSADKELFALVSTILFKMHSDNLLSMEHQRMASDAEEVLS